MTRHSSFARRSGRAAILVGTVALAGCGLLQTGGGGTVDTSTLPAEYVVWGDPASDDQHPLVRDANNLSDRGLFVGSDGRVVFSAGNVCDSCTVERAVISVNEVPLVAIRFGPDLNGENVRRPYLVSADEAAVLIQLVSEGDAIVFQETDEPFEDPDDSSDDLAVVDGVVENPDYNPPNQGLLGSCGQGMLLWAPLTALGIGLMYAGRRRL
jgi:hypothetical protein